MSCLLHVANASRWIWQLHVLCLLWLYLSVDKTWSGPGEWLFQLPQDIASIRLRKEVSGRWPWTLWWQQGLTIRYLLCANYYDVGKLKIQVSSWIDCHHCTMFPLLLSSAFVTILGGTPSHVLNVTVLWPCREYCIFFSFLLFYFVWFYSKAFWIFMLNILNLPAPLWLRTIVLWCKNFAPLKNAIELHDPD